MFQFIISSTLFLGFLSRITHGFDSCPSGWTPQEHMCILADPHRRIAPDQLVEECKKENAVPILFNSGPDFNLEQVKLESNTHFCLGPVGLLRSPTSGPNKLISTYFVRSRCAALSLYNNVQVPRSCELKCSLLCKKPSVDMIWSYSAKLPSLIQQNSDIEIQEAHPGVVQQTPAGSLPSNITHEDLQHVIEVLAKKLIEAEQKLENYTKGMIDVEKEDLHHLIEVLAEKLTKAEKDLERNTSQTSNELFKDVHRVVEDMKQDNKENRHDMKDMHHRLGALSAMSAITLLAVAICLVVIIALLARNQNLWRYRPLGDNPNYELRSEALR